MATIKDIANKLGISPATVSRALNDFPEIKDATKAKVKAMAEELGYRPNKSAQKLVSGKSHSVGVILKYASAQTADPSLYEMMIGLSQYLAEKDLDLIFQVAVSEDEVSPYKRLLGKQSVDGFIISAPTRNDPRIEYLQQQKVPFVVHGKGEYGEVDYAYYDIDNYAVGYDSTHLLQQLGHQKIALINGPDGLAFSRDRRRGYIAAMEEANNHFDENLITFGPVTESYAYQAASKLLDSSTPPTAFVCANTPSASGVLSCLRDRNLSCPEDVSIIAHDDGYPGYNTELLEPQLTVTYSPLRDACVPLADIMAQLENGESPSNLQITHKADLILRRSTGPAPIRN